MTHHNGKPWRQPAFRPAKQLHRIFPMISAKGRPGTIGTATPSFELASLALILARQQLARDSPKVDPQRLQLRSRYTYWGASGGDPGRTVVVWELAWCSRKDPTKARPTDKMLFVDWATLKLVE